VILNEFFYSSESVSLDASSVAAFNSFSDSKRPFLSSPLACPMLLANLGIFLAPNRTIIIIARIKISCPPRKANSCVVII